MNEPICRVCDTAITPEAQKFLLVTDKDFRPIHPTCLINQQAKDIDQLRAEVTRLEGERQNAQIALSMLATERDALKGEISMLREAIVNAVENITGWDNREIAIRLSVVYDHTEPKAA